MFFLLQKLPMLESMNLAGCHHITDKTVNTICKNLHNIQQLNFTQVKALSEAAILKLLTKCPTIRHLDIYDNPNISQQGQELIKALCLKNPSLTVLLKGLNVEKTVAENSSLTLALAGVSTYW